MLCNKSALSLANIIGTSNAMGHMGQLVICAPESATMLTSENDVCHNVFINLPQVHTILVQCGHSNPHGQSSIPHEKEILDEWVWHQQCGCQGAIFPLLLVCILVWWDIVAKLWCLVKEHRGQHLPEHCPAGLWLITFKFSKFDLCQWNWVENRT